MDSSLICLGCMDNLGEFEVCPNCGWVKGSANESPLHLQPGIILAEKYLIGRVLGQGGFGITYLAWDIFLERKLAIKEYFPRDLCYRNAGDRSVVIHSGTMLDQYQYGLDKFLAEGKTLAKFDGHPNIVAVRDYFTANDSAYLVMSYLEGVTMAGYLEEKGGRLTFEEVIKIIMPVMDALKVVHEAGLLHRDISPDNIMITLNGRVVILDFGAARHAIGEKVKKFSVIIKPGYAPEEQYRSSGKQGPWTDIYALGATLYRALTGVMPPESLDRLSSDTLPVPSAYGAILQPQEESAILRALSVKAEERFQRIEDFQNALTAVASSPGYIITGQERCSEPVPASINSEEGISEEIIPLYQEPAPLPAEDIYISIGRAPDNIIILNDAAVSRHHASIYSQNGILYIQDLQSSHGTLLNGCPLNSPMELHPGSRLRFSSYGAYYDGARLLSEQGEILYDFRATGTPRPAQQQAARIQGGLPSRLFIIGGLALAFFILIGLATFILKNGDAGGQNTGLSTSPLNEQEGSTALSSQPAAEEELMVETIVFSDGTYTGQVKDGKPHGYGVYLYKQAEVLPGTTASGGDFKYEGYWQEGKKHGEGVMTYPEGYTRRGTWENDIYLPQN